jgi:hypothetical protein
MQKLFADQALAEGALCALLEGPYRDHYRSNEAPATAFVSMLAATVKAVLGDEISAFGEVLGREIDADGAIFVWIKLNEIAFRVPLSDLACLPDNRRLPSQRKASRL